MQVEIESQIDLSDIFAAASRTTFIRGTPGRSAVHNLPEIDWRDVSARVRPDVDQPLGRGVARTPPAAASAKLPSCSQMSFSLTGSTWPKFEANDCAPHHVVDLRRLREPRI